MHSNNLEKVRILIPTPFWPIDNWSFTWNVCLGEDLRSNLIKITQGEGQKPETKLRVAELKFNFFYKY